MPRTKTATKSSTKSASVNTQKDTHSDSDEIVYVKKNNKDNGQYMHQREKSLAKTSTKGDISRIVSQATRNIRRKPPKDNDELVDRIDEYFQITIENSEIPTVEGLAKACGVCRETLHEWQNNRKTNPERSDIIKKAKETMAEIDAILVAEGRIPQVVYIFRAKNYYGMRDQQEVVLTPNDPLGDEASEKALKQKYLEDIGAKPIDV